MLPRLRARYLAAMGLPAALAACPREADAPPIEVPLPPTSALPRPSATADASPAASAAPLPTASGSAAPTASALPTKPTGPNVPSWDVAFPFPPGDKRAQWGCQQRARCFALGDVVRAFGGTSAPTTAKGCPPKVDVPCGCTPGAICDEPDAQCPAAKLDDVSAKQSTSKGQATCCYGMPDHCIPPWVGRALRGEGGALASCPPASAREDWSAGQGGPGAASQRWERIAAMEHASVASFARASLALLALGAPAELLRATHEAALDEIEHARLAYGLASRGAVRLGPAPLEGAVSPLAPVDLAAFAVATFRDACVGETLGAEAARREAEGATEPERSVLARIADDEARHAELAWRTLAWCVREGGAPARAALAAALDAARTERHAPRDVFDAVVAPCAEALLG